MTKDNNKASQYRKGSILDTMRLEPWEYPRDLTMDFSTLSKSDNIELRNCTRFLMSWKSGVDKDLDYNEVRKTIDHMLDILSKARDLSIKSHLDKRGSR